MPLLAVEVPDVVVKPFKMLNYMTSRVRVGALAIGFLLYMYIIVFIKDAYERGKRMDRMMGMIAENKKQMLLLQGIDQELAARMEQVDSIYSEY